MIKVKCESCDKVYQLPDSAAGRKARCKACGEAMVIPDAPDDLFDDSPSTSDDLTSLYSSSDPSEVIDHSIASEDPMAFNPETSFQQSTKSRSVSPLPMKFILAGAGGGLALVLIVVVIIVVMSGNGDDDQNDSSGALAFDAGASAPSGQPVRPEPGTNTTPNTDTSEPDSSGETVEPEPEVVVEPIDLTPPDSEDTDDLTGVDTAEPIEAPDTVIPVQAGSNLLSAPTSAEYAIMLPADLDLISQTRVAVRTTALEDGTWLAMEVHKLSGLDRRAKTPVNEDGSTVLVRGRRVAMPTGVEVSEIASDHYTIQRLLYPERVGQDTRRVEYVIKDGPFLISVLGRFPTGDAARLAILDEAAKSVQPLEGQ